MIAIKIQLGNKDFELEMNLFSNNMNLSINFCIH
jgi:hypothetical protein